MDKIIFSGRSEGTGTAPGVPIAITNRRRLIKNTGLGKWNPMMEDHDTDEG